jgi:hypothetical protein
MPDDSNQPSQFDSTLSNVRSTSIRLERDVKPTLRRHRECVEFDPFLPFTTVRQATTPGPTFAISVVFGAATFQSQTRVNDTTFRLDGQVKPHGLVENYSKVDIGWRFHCESKHNSRFAMG